MKIFKSIYHQGFICIIPVLLVFLNISCQYDYKSPLPGIIEIYIKSLPKAGLEYSEFNNFVIKVDRVFAIRSDQGMVKIFEDTKAIETSTITVNTLDSTARDGTLMIGRTYVPPGDYIGVDMYIEPGTAIITGARGVEQQIVEVRKNESFTPVLAPRKPYKVRESQSIRITIVIDLENSLQKGAYDYTFTPRYDLTIE